MKKIFNKYKYMLLAIFITICGFGVLFRCYDIYPFGSHAINMVDFDSGYIPVYYKLWDVIHLQSPISFDWNLGTGMNSLGSLIGNGFFSPLCWVIALFPRDSIPYTISYVFLFKMVFVEIMTYIAIGKIFPKTEEKYKILFSLMYTFSSWTFLMASNLLYIDAFALFPLLVYSIKELLEHGKWKLYTILLTLTLMFSYYIAWLDLFFIIGMTGISLFVMKTDRKKEKAVKILICTLLALAISSISFIPGFMFTRSSTRLANNTSNDGIFSFFMSKSIYLFTLAIPLVITIRQLFVKKDKRLNLFILLSLLFLLLGVVIEPINALWHTGSHNGFPFRYAYQPTLFTILVSVYYLNNNKKDKKKCSLIRIITPIIGMISLFVFFMIMKSELIQRNIFAYDLDKWPDYIALLVMFIISVVTMIFIMRNNKKSMYVLSCFLFATVTIVFGCLYFQNDYSSSSVEMQKLLEKIELKNDGYNYATDEKYNINFPYILKVPSMSNRIHFIRQEEVDQMNYLGYSILDTIISSRGGTDFSDVLLNNKYFLTTKPLDDEYYELIEKKDEWYYYQTNNNFNYVIPYNGKDYNEKNNNFIENANNIYKNLFDGKSDIYDKDDNYTINEDVISINLRKGKRYIIRIKCSKFTKIDIPQDNNIIIEKKLLTSNFKPTDSLTIYLKANADVLYNLTVVGDNRNVDIYTLNQNELVNFVTNNNLDNVKITTDGAIRKYELNTPKDTSILIPIIYSPDYEIKVNGEVVDYKCNLYNMISIDVKQGDNTIEIVHKQKWFKIGAIVTVATLLIFGLFYLINRKIRLLNIKLILWPLFIICFGAFAFLIVKVYILSWIKILIK